MRLEFLKGTYFYYDKFFSVPFILLKFFDLKHEIKLPCEWETHTHVHETFISFKHESSYKKTRFSSTTYAISRFNVWSKIFPIF